MQTICGKGSVFPVCLQGLLNRQLNEYIRLFTMSQPDFLIQTRIFSVVIGTTVLKQILYIAQPVASWKRLLKETIRFS